MWTPLKEAKTALVNQFLRPKKLLDVIATHPELSFDLEAAQSSSISLGQVVHWERLAEQLVDGRRGYKLNNGQAYLSALAFQNGQYQFVPLALPAVTGSPDWTGIEQDWHCDLSEVQGLSASMSELPRFESPAQFLRTQIGK